MHRNLRPPRLHSWRPLDPHPLTLAARADLHDRMLRTVGAVVALVFLGVATGMRLHDLATTRTEGAP